MTTYQFLFHGTQLLLCGLHFLIGQLEFMLEGCLLRLCSRLHAEW